MSITPAMQQFYDLKELYPDSILFFRMGDFYEMFDDDAKIAHKILGINLTSRNKNAENPIPLAGIPYHAKEKYLWKLIEAWYKVAIAEQVSDPNLKWIVKREVVRVVTPATLSLEEEWYKDSENTPLSICSVVESDGRYGISIIDISSKDWFCSEFNSKDMLFTELYKISPREIILEKNLMQDSDIDELLTKKYNLNIYYHEMRGESKKFLLSKMNLANLSSLWIEGKDLAIKSSAYILNYLEENQKTDFSFIGNLRYESFSGVLELDEATIKSLDLVYNVATSSQVQGTLFWVLNHTKTPMGKRFLRSEILRPLQDIKEIEKRQKFMSLLKESPMLLEALRKNLSEVADIEAILTRLQLDRVGPKDLLLLKKSLIAIREVIRTIENSDNKKLQKIFD